MSHEVHRLSTGPRQDSDEDQAIGLDRDDLGHRRGRLPVANDDMHTRAEIERPLEVLQAGVDEPFTVGTVVIDRRSQVIASP